MSLESIRAVAFAVFLLPLAFPQQVAAAEEAVHQSAAVIVANRTVISLRGPIAGYSAEERATSAMRRIKEALEADPAAMPSAQPVDGMAKVLLGGKLAFMVTRIDIDEQAGETTLIVAQEAAKRMQTSITEWHDQTTPRYLANAAVLSAAATLAYGVVLWFLYRGSRWLGQRVSAVADEQARKLHVGGTVRTLTQQFFTLLAWVLGLGVTSIWLAFVLRRFPYTRAWGENLGDNLVEFLLRVLLAIVGAAPGLLVVGVVFLLAKVLLGLARVFFDRVEAGNTRISWLDAESVRPTRRIFNFAAWLFALAIAYPYLPGASTDAFKGVSVLVGLMLSLGGASVIGQAFSGLILMYARIFRRGDYVRIGDFEGTVTELGMFATRIRTGMGEEITVSNASVLNLTTKNYSRAVEGTGYVMDTVVTIGYSTPWRQVHAMLEEAARRTPDVAAKPAPIVRQTALSDFYVEYRLIAYTPLEQARARAEVLSDLHGNIQDVFNEHGVQIMSPHYLTDPAKPQIVPKEKWHTPPA